MKAHYTQIGGARLGWTNVTWPFVKLEVYDDRICLFGSPILKSDIDKLTKHNGFFSTGLRIWRKNNDETLIFWTFDFSGLTKALLDSGYTISI
jgi:hypothetical protein